MVMLIWMLIEVGLEMIRLIVFFGFLVIGILNFLFILLFFVKLIVDLVFLFNISVFDGKWDLVC